MARDIKALRDPNYEPPLRKVAAERTPVATGPMMKKVQARRAARKAARAANASKPYAPTRPDKRVRDPSSAAQNNTGIVPPGMVGKKVIARPPLTIPGRPVGLVGTANALMKKNPLTKR